VYYENSIFRLLGKPARITPINTEPSKPYRLEGEIGAHPEGIRRRSPAPAHEAAGKRPLRINRLSAAVEKLLAFWKFCV
jgi:hypothetical protein